MRIRLSPCVVQGIRTWENSQYVDFVAPNERFSAVAYPKDPDNPFDALARLGDLYRTFQPAEVEIEVQARVTKEGKPFNVLLNAQYRPLVSNGADPAKK